jgi:F-box/WD-40 domain protein MET30
MSWKHSQPLDNDDLSCEPPHKRRRSSGLLSDPAATPTALRESHGHDVGAKEHHERRTKDQGRESITNDASSARLASQAVAPFLAKHIPNQYAPLGSTNGGNTNAPEDPNSKFCYRHRPDMLCRRQADEPSMDKLQKVNTTSPTTSPLR